MIRVKYSVLSGALINKLDIEVFVKSEFNLTDELYDRCVKLKVDRFVQTHNAKYVKECHYNKKLFASKNAAWLDREFVCELNNNIIDAAQHDEPEHQSSSANGTCGTRKSKPFEECSQRTQRRRCKELQETTSEQQVQQTFFNNLRKSNQSLDVKIIEQLLAMTIEDKQKVFKVIQKGIHPMMYTPDEALALFVDAKMTKAQYELMAHGASQRNASIYPSYQRIIDAKKRCYPNKESIKITDVSVTINLQALLDITCAR